jgi:hypothetical protein
LFSSDIGHHPELDLEKTGDHHEEDLANFGYKPNRNYKTLVIPPYASSTLTTKYKDLAVKKYISSLLLVIKNFKKHIISNF